MEGGHEKNPERSDVSDLSISEWSDASYPSISYWSDGSGLYIFSGWTPSDLSIWQWSDASDLSETRVLINLTSKVIIFLVLTTGQPPPYHIAAAMSRHAKDFSNLHLPSQEPEEHYYENQACQFHAQHVHFLFALSK